MRQALLISIWQLSANLLLTSSPLKASSGWMGADAHFQVSPEIFDWVQSQAVAGQLKDIELYISHSWCVLRVIVLLEGEPSAQSEVLNALDWVFIKAISIFCCTERSFYSDESLSPATENSPTAWACCQETLLLGWYSAGDEQSWFPSNIMLRMRSSDQRILFLRVWGFFRCFFVNSKCVFMCLAE